MALISIQEVSLGFGGPRLLDGVNLQIEEGERIGVLGRNGAGKSTLLKLINGDLSPHNGTIARQQGIRSAYLPQEVPVGIHGRAEDLISAGLISTDFADDEAHWKRIHQLQKTISMMNLDGQALFENMSAGMKRRIVLARGLVCNPELLLLDEPTNHLDINAIDWLEDFLKRWGGTLIFVTHDRIFLEKLSTRIIELDRGRLIDWDCNYSTFIRRKEDLLAAEQIQNSLFDKKLAQEEAWIRKGIEARRTRNEGRVRALKRLRQARSERRELLGKVKMQIGSEKMSGRLVVEAENVSYFYEDKPIIQNFSTTIQRGDKIGVVGANGSGKTTLLKLLLQQLDPAAGTVRHGANLEIVYFDQLRSQLDENRSVLDNVGQGRDTVTINGRTRNLMGYLEDFLFSRDRVHAPLRALSGGERNRLLLARLFAQPANLIVLDEPTNDLDIDTLEVLEDLLSDFEGTLLLVSHDRAFLDHLVTSTLVLDGKGGVKEFIGGYEDWQDQLADGNSASPSDEKRDTPARAESKPRNSSPSRKLSYNEMRELEELPARIETLEAEQHSLNQKMESPAFYQQDNLLITQAVERLQEIQHTLARAYQRWAELED